MKYRVKELAKRQGMTQFDLATRSEVSLTVVQRLWQNRAPEGIRHNTLDAIAKALGVQITDLYTEVPEDSEGSATLRVNRESLVSAAA